MPDKDDARSPKQRRQRALYAVAVCSFLLVASGFFQVSVALPRHGEIALGFGAFELTTPESKTHSGLFRQSSGPLPLGTVTVTAAKPFARDRLDTDGPQKAYPDGIIHAPPPRWRLLPRVFEGWEKSYSVIVPLWAMFVMPALMLISTYRAGRRLRGHACVNCGYDRSGIEYASPCPECGQSV